MKTREEIEVMPDGDRTTLTARSYGRDTVENPIDYFSNLNSMREAEQQGLNSPCLWNLYCKTLGTICADDYAVMRDGKLLSPHPIFSTGRQRNTAFLMVIL